MSTRGDVSAQATRQVSNGPTVTASQNFGISRAPAPQSRGSTVGRWWHREARFLNGRIHLPHMR